MTHEVFASQFTKENMCWSQLIKKLLVITALSCVTVFILVVVLLTLVTSPYFDLKRLTHCHTLHLILNEGEAASSAFVQAVKHSQNAVVQVRRTVWRLLSSRSQDVTLIQPVHRILFYLQILTGNFCVNNNTVIRHKKFRTRWKLWEEGENLSVIFQSSFHHYSHHHHLHRCLTEITSLLL